MSAPTPAPWSVTTNAQTGRVYVANPTMPRGTGMVAEMLACESLEHVPANAALIAAAPAMLVALEAQDAVDEHIANCEDCCDGAFPELCEEGFPIADRARVLREGALSTARGEPSPAPGAEGVLTVALEVGEGGK